MVLDHNGNEMGISGDLENAGGDFEFDYFSLGLSHIDRAGDVYVKVYWDGASQDSESVGTCQKFDEVIIAEIAGETHYICQNVVEEADGSNPTTIPKRIIPSDNVSDIRVVLNHDEVVEVSGLE